MYAFEKLLEPFYADEVEWRIQNSGVKGTRPWGFVLCYVTNRAIQNRLDETFGPQNWKNEFKSGPNGGVICGISVNCGEWVTKWDGADNTEIEEIKGGLSGAMKRAAVQWGIGRYLYELDATFALFSDGGAHSTKIDGTRYKWDPPELPEWALPSPLAQKRDIECLVERLRQCKTGEDLEFYAKRIKPKVVRNKFSELFVDEYRMLYRGAMNGSINGEDRSPVQGIGDD